MGMQGDFFQLLKEQGYQFGGPATSGSGIDIPNATTILAFKYRDGVLVAGDRRATTGNMVMYDRTDKVLEIDRHSVMAIAGVQRRRTRWSGSWNIPSSTIGGPSFKN